jgi:hypothetical protein
MKDLICDEFQNVVGELLIRHRSILDILTKLSEASGRVNRAVAKSVTDCGCISVQAEKRCIPNNIETFAELSKLLDDHVQGNLCPSCEDIVMSEMGKLLFYVAALCNTLDINLYDVLIKEYKKATTLGIYNLT